MSSFAFRPVHYFLFVLLMGAVPGSAADLDIGKTRRFLERSADTYSMPISPTGSAEYQCVTRRAKLDDSAMGRKSYRFVVELPDRGEVTDEPLDKLPLVNLVSEPRYFSLKPYKAAASFNGTYIAQWKNTGSGISLYDHLYQPYSGGKLYVETIAKPTFTAGSADARWDEFRKNYDPAIMDEEGVAVSYSECALREVEPLFQFEMIAGSVGEILPSSRKEAVRQIKWQFPQLDFRMLTPQPSTTFPDNLQEFQLGFAAKGIRLERLTSHFATGKSYHDTFRALLGLCAADVKAKFPDPLVIQAWFCNRTGHGYGEDRRTRKKTDYNQTVQALVLVKDAK